MCQPIVVANWKMHLGRPADAVALIRRIRPRLSRVTGVEVVVCPPFTALPALADTLAASPLALGAQTMHWDEEGAHTGEVSAPMLCDWCRYVIVGHSERRAAGGEAEGDSAAGRRVRAALAHDLTPILCVGEDAARNDAGETDRYVGGQLRAALDGLSADQIVRCVIAYEPVWAIGTGRAATPAVANRTAGLTVRGIVADLHGEREASAIRVLYGGSVTAGNVAAFVAMPDIDGVLVGGVSLDVEFAELVENVAAATGPPRASPPGRSGRSRPR